METTEDIFVLKHCEHHFKLPT